MLTWLSPIQDKYVDVGYTNTIWLIDIKKTDDQQIQYVSMLLNQKNNKPGGAEP